MPKHIYTPDWAGFTSGDSADIRWEKSRGLLWREIKESLPEVAEAIAAEYQRVNGAVPYEQGFVYAIQAEGTNFLKFGKTINPERRLLQISPKMPFNCRFVRVWRSNFMSLAERSLHGDFDSYRVNGEWFDLPRHELSRVFEETGCYEMMIRNAYGQEFFFNVFLGSKPGAETSFIDLANHAAGLPSGIHEFNAPEMIALIESLFASIERENSRRMSF